ncbi:MAG TPA: hemolysin family protein [Lacibacter sp.]|nr:hemolysin family protein [Lacibacter sp.]HMO88481.1 hemolysin family protein [Lacibacter sp.]HMP87795.1 hemolysin family protein [Lacibacter sp.]
MNWYLIGGIGITLLLVGFFTGLETAYATMNRFSVELKKKQGLASGRILSSFVDNPARFIGVTLVGITLMLTLYGLLINRAIEPHWKRLPDILQGSWLRLFLELGIATTLVLLVEFLFMGIFKARSTGLLSTFARLTLFFYNLFAPVGSLVIGLSQWILKYLFDVRVSDRKDAFNRIDLEHFIQQSRDTNDDAPELNTELFENALSLPGVKVRECLVPRKEIVGVEAGSPLNVITQKFIDTKLSKLIVYEENIDNIIGYVHQLDLFRKPADLKSVLHPIPAVPESMGITDLINRFTKERKSIAWVVDEFGGTSGIVTMEDLLEEIFGEIQDEYDTEEFVEKQLSEDEFIFSGRLELDYLREKYKLEFDEETSSETLSGYIVEHHETIPTIKERIIIRNYEFDIINVNETRIETVKMRILH